MNLLARYRSAVLIAVGLMLLAGCARRSEEDFDNRTLERRPHVETTKPEDRSDPFRP